jgi:hypothetical protein
VRACSCLQTCCVNACFRACATACTTPKVCTGAVKTTRRVPCCPALLSCTPAHLPAHLHTCTRLHACTPAGTPAHSTPARPRCPSRPARSSTLERGAAACQPAPTPKHAQCAEPALAPLSCYKLKLTEQHTSTPAHLHTCTLALTPRHVARAGRTGRRASAATHTRGRR